MQILQIEDLLIIFSNINYEEDDILTQNQITLILDQLLGNTQIFDTSKNEKYDRDIIQQIIDNCISSGYGYQVKAICETFIKAEVMLLQKLSKIENQMQSYMNQIDICQERAQLYQNHPKNNFGVNEDATVEIQIIEVTLFQQKIDELMDENIIFVKLSSTHQQYESEQAIYIGETKTYQWNQPHSYKFQSEHSREHIIVEIGNRKTMIGKVVIQLDDYRNQMLQEQVFNLIDLGNVKISIHFIHDKLKYYKQMEQLSITYMDDLKKDQEDFQKELDRIRQPFIKGNSIIQSNDLGNLNNNTNEDMRETQEEITQNIWQIMTGVWILLLISNVFSCLYRYSFLDVIIISQIVRVIIFDDINKKSMQYLNYFILFSDTYDIVWLILNQNVLWNIFEFDDTLDIDQQMILFAQQFNHQTKISVIFTYIGLILKTMLMYYIYKIQQLIKFSRVNFKFVIMGKLIIFKSIMDG